MFIQTEETPNPNAMKFFPGTIVMGAGSIEFTTKEAARRSPLAEQIFDIQGISGVFLGSDFISVSKHEEYNWDVLIPFVIESITIHFSSGVEVLSETDQVLPSRNLEDLDPLSRQIVDILDSRVRPAVAQDGGDIVFEKFENGIVYVSMKGACSGCPSSLATLKNGIENMLRHYVPEVQEVQAITASE
jgi:Fe-S cluster biogenesis protein NfuA